MQRFFLCSAAVTLPAIAAGYGYVEHPVPCTFPVGNATGPYTGRCVTLCMRPGRGQPGAAATADVTQTLPVWTISYLRLRSERHSFQPKVTVLRVADPGQGPHEEP